MSLSSQPQYLKIEALMKSLGVSERDCREQFLCSPGKGGQNVNKVETAVALLHLPTGISVKCHAERSQNANRWRAWALLLAKIEERQKQVARAAVAKREKLRRQKRGRTVKGKELMLAGKKFKGQKKLERSKQFIKKMLTVLFLFFIFGRPWSAEAREPLMVFASASLSDSLKELAVDFKKEYKVDVVFNFGAPSTLRMAIENGSPCDVFVGDKGNADALLEKNFVDEKVVVKLLLNRLVILADAKNPEQLSSLYDIRLSAGDHFAIADPEADPAGVSAIEVLTKADVIKKVEPYLVSAMDVRAAQSLVLSGNAKYAIVYVTDAMIVPNANRVYTVPARLHDQITYSAAVIKNDDNLIPARNFLSFLQTEHSKMIFKKYGFQPL